MNADLTGVHWVPSHVRIKVHQARELHLKSKTGPCEVYMVLRADKEKYISSSLPLQTCPFWNEDFVIPLMSLATTIDVTVRQKGRFGDAYLGFLSIIPGNFKISSSPVTHSYKLGSKPGKKSTKLRGDLQISLQFLSKWSEHMDPSVGAGKELVSAQAGMLKQSSSASVKSWTENGMRTENGLGFTDPIESNGKKEIFSSLRRSFRRRNKPSVSKICDVDFTPLHSLTPQLKRSNTLVGVTPSSIIPTGQVTIGQFTDSDTSVTSIPSAAMPTRGSTVASAEGTLKLVAEKKTEGTASSDASGKMITASKFQYFKSKKRPWSMQGLTFDTPLPILGSDISQQISHRENEHEPLVEQELAKTSQTEGAVMSTFKYQSRASIVSRSPKGYEKSTTSPNAENQRLLDEEIGSGGSLKPMPPYEGNVSSLGVALSEDDVNLVEGDGDLNQGKSASESPASKRPLTKTHPYSRRIEITPRTTSPSSVRLQPQVMVDGRTEQNLSSTTPPSARKNLAILKRRRTISSLPSNRRPLPASPVPRNHSQTNGGVSPVVSPPASSCRKKKCEVQGSNMEAVTLRGDVTAGGAMDSANSKWEKNRTQHARSSSQGVNDEGKRSRPMSCIVESRTNPTPAEIEVPAYSKDDNMLTARRSSQGVSEEVERRRPKSCIVESRTNPTPAGIKAPAYSKDDNMLTARSSQGVSEEVRRRRPMSCIVESRTNRTPAGIKAPAYSKDDNMLTARSSQGVSEEVMRRRPMSCIVESRTNRTPAGIKAPAYSKDDNMLTARSSQGVSEEVKRRRPMSCIVESRTNPTPAGIKAPAYSKDGDMLTARVKHTVQYKHTSSSGFQPVSLLPPSLSDYTLWSQTLPVRGKQSKRLSASQVDPNDPNSATAAATTTAEGKPQSVPVLATSQRFNRSPTNTRFLPRAAMSYAKTSPTLSEIAKDDAGTDSRRPDSSATQTTPVMITTPTSWSNNSSNISVSSERLTIGYRGKTPGEIVTSAMLKRRPAGGLKKAISLYYESRKQYNVSDGRTGTPLVNDEDRLSLQGVDGDAISVKTSQADKEVIDRACVSAGNSPDLGRPHSIAESFGNIFVSSLKKTSSLLFTGASQYNSQVAPNIEDDTGSANQHVFHDNMHINAQRDEKFSAPAILVRTLTSKESPDQNCTAETFEMDQSLASVETVTSVVLGQDSSSVKTLTDSDSQTAMVHRHSPNPAGAAAAAVGGGSYVRHTTSSSVESEGFHSMSGEDMEMEQDLMTWSKERLVKELVQCKLKQKGVEDKLNETQKEMSAIQLYMDTLLLRIMETNPSLLSTNSQ